ncbi:MAG: hypothetical protein FGM33_03250 [Candidatus Kapabacteria bacterium]|nr:hypothetical protein [Candidatus Kapabacteria bacterium]
MYRPLTLTCVVILCLAAGHQHSKAQTGRVNQPAVPLGRMHGTWFNARFIEELNRSRSLMGAMSKVTSSDPLWVRIDTTAATSTAVVGYNVNRVDSMPIFKKVIKGAGQKWVIGNTEQPFWMLADDEIARAYIALTSLDSLDSQPIVLGALPSKNPDPLFILRRMVNNSILAGKWKRADGKEVRFSNDLVMTVGAESVRYNMSFERDGAQARITTTDGQPVSWIVERAGRKLTLRPTKGAPQVLTLLP